MLARYGMGGVTLEVCERIACGIVTQAQAGPVTLFECSSQFPLGALPCSHPTCQKYGGCPPVFQAAQAPAPAPAAAPAASPAPAITAAAAPVAPARVTTPAPAATTPAPAQTYRYEAPAPAGSAGQYTPGRAIQVSLPEFNPQSGRRECPDAYPVGSIDQYGQLICKRTAQTDVPVGWPYPTGAAVRAAATGPVSRAAGSGPVPTGGATVSEVESVFSWCSEESIISGVGNCVVAAVAAGAALLLLARRRAGRGA